MKFLKKKNNVKGNKGIYDDNKIEYETFKRDLEKVDHATKMELIDNTYLTNYYEDKYDDKTIFEKFLEKLIDNIKTDITDYKVFYVVSNKDSELKCLGQMLLHQNMAKFINHMN